MIKDNPYKFICDHYEKRYLHMGRKVFSILSLLPVSLIIPDINTDKVGTIKSNLNVLVISPPGTAKSSIGDQFKKICYDPFPFEYISDSKLNSVLSSMSRVSLITTDIARIFSNNVLLKQLENITGDEKKLSRFTQLTNKEEKPIEAVAYLAGTPENLNSTITEGILFRVSPILIFHTEKEHTQILKYVNDSIGKVPNSNDDEEEIIEYYQKLLRIQDGENKDIEPIVGYIIDPKFNEEIIKVIEPLVSKPFKDTNFTFVRELHQCYRYLVSHAFLNIFNRKRENNMLIPNEEDLKIALKLSTREIKTKAKILTCNSIVSERKLRTITELKDWVHNNIKEELNPTDFGIIKGIINKK